MEKLIDNYNGVNFPKRLYSQRDKQRIYDRLAEYESIGLTPQQLLQVDELYAEKCKELAELKRKIKELSK